MFSTMKYNLTSTALEIIEIVNLNDLRDNHAKSILIRKGII